MLRLIIRKEIVSHILSLRFGVTFILFIILVFAGIYVTVNEHRLELNRYGSRVRTYREKLSDILDEEQDWGAHGRLRRLFWNEGKSEAIPISKLAWMGEGLQSVLPVGVNATAYTSRNIDRGPTRNALMGMLTTPDFVYMVNVVLSLLAILFMFDAVCGEKEAGTLRLMLSNSVPRYLILLGKWIGGYVVLLLPFLIATTGGIGYAWTCGVLEWDLDNVVRIAVLIALGCVYIAVFFNLSLFVSTTTSNSATSLLVCLLVWVIFTLAIPNLAPVSAKILEPVPSLEKIRAEKRSVNVEIRLRMNRLTQTSGELSYGEKIQREREKLERERTRRHRQWDALYDRARERQFKLAQTFGRFSPSATWVYAAVGLTNTGPKVSERFEEGIKRFADSFETFKEKYFDKGNDGAETWPKIMIDELPALNVTFPTTSKVLDDALNDILLLIVFNVMFFMLAFMFFLRYDVR